MRARDAVLASLAVAVTPTSVASTERGRGGIR
jgi:hypothetical protein